MSERIIEWAKELQSLAQAGLHYGHDDFDRERYRQIVGSGTLHQACEFHGSVPIGIGFDQYEHPGFRFQEGTEIPVIALCCRKAQFEA